MLSPRKIRWRTWGSSCKSTPFPPQDLSKHNSCSSSPDSTGFMETLLSVVFVCHDTPPCFSRLSLILLLSLLHLLFPLPGKLMTVTMLSFSS